MKGSSTILVAFLLLSACAGYPAPTERVATALRATQAAEEAGARRVPRAALQLKLADDEAAAARALMEEGRNERAAMMALRARTDAELARSLAREEGARLRAENARAAAAAAELTKP